MFLVKFNVRTSKNENSLEIVSDENLNLNNKFIKRGEVNIWKVPTHKGRGGGVKPNTYECVQEGGGLILAEFVRTYYVHDP